MGLAAVVAASLSFTNNVQAATATGTTSLTITVPPFVVLYYPSALNIVLADPGTTQTATSSVSWAEGNADPSPSLTVSSADVYANNKAITIPNIWAIRGISASGKASVSITGTSGQTTTVSNTGKDIDVSGLQVSSDSVEAGTNILVPLAGMTPVYGNVLMTLDMDELNSGAAGIKSGNYTGGQYTITVQVL